MIQSYQDKISEAYENLSVKSVRCGNCGERLYIPEDKFEILYVRHANFLYITCRKCRKVTEVKLIINDKGSVKLEGSLSSVKEESICDIQCLTSGRPTPKRSNKIINRNAVIFPSNELKEFERIPVDDLERLWVIEPVYISYHVGKAALIGGYVLGKRKPLFYALPQRDGTYLFLNWVDRP